MPPGAGSRWLTLQIPTGIAPKFTAYRPNKEPSSRKPAFTCSFDAQLAGIAADPGRNGEFILALNEGAGAVGGGSGCRACGASACAVSKGLEAGRFKAGVEALIPFKYACLSPLDSGEVCQFSCQRYIRAARPPGLW
jgi:hypothetical protein